MTRITDNFTRNPKTGRAAKFRPYPGYDPMDGMDERVTLSPGNPCGELADAEWEQCHCEDRPSPQGPDREPPMSAREIGTTFGTITAIVAVWAVWSSLNG